MVSSFSLPKVMEAEIEAVIKAGYYSSKSEVVKDALRLLFETRKELKTASAVELYINGDIYLGKASEIAGVTVIEFKELLASRGIYRELEGESREEMDKKLEKISD
jgi:putative addiction module CopG family antidote